MKIDFGPCDFSGGKRTADSVARDAAALRQAFATVMLPMVAEAESNLRKLREHLERTAQRTEPNRNGDV